MINYINLAVNKINYEIYENNNLNFKDYYLKIHNNYNNDKSIGIIYKVKKSYFININNLTLKIFNKINYYYSPLIVKCEGISIYKQKFKIEKVKIINNQFDYIFNNIVMSSKQYFFILKIENINMKNIDLILYDNRINSGIIIYDYIKESYDLKNQLNIIFYFIVIFFKIKSNKIYILSDINQKKIFNINNITEFSYFINYLKLNINNSKTCIATYIDDINYLEEICECRYFINNRKFIDLNFYNVFITINNFKDLNFTKNNLKIISLYSNIAIIDKVNFDFYFLN